MVRLDFQQRYLQEETRAKRGRLEKRRKHIPGVFQESPEWMSPRGHPYTDLNTSRTLIISWGYSGIACRVPMHYARHHISSKLITSYQSRVRFGKTFTPALDKVKGSRYDKDLRFIDWLLWRTLAIFSRVSIGSTKEKINKTFPNQIDYLEEKVTKVWGGFSDVNIVIIPRYRASWTYKHGRGQLFAFYKTLFPGKCNFASGLNAKSCSFLMSTALFTSKSIFPKPFPNFLIK